MTIFTIIGFSVCIILGTLFVGIFFACLVTSGVPDSNIFYFLMFMGSWMVSVAFLILLIAMLLL